MFNTIHDSHIETELCFSLFSKDIFLLRFFLIPKIFPLPRYCRVYKSPSFKIATMKI